MPRVHKKKAKFDTYNRGLKVKAKTKSGVRIDRSKASDENDTLFCKKGETYYSWTFRYGGTHKSLKRPKMSQLTQSGFLIQIYSLREEIELMDATDMTESERDEIVSRLEEIRDEVEESRMQMPEHLQDVGVGEMLTERHDSVEEMINEFETIECYEDEESDEEMIYDAWCEIEYQGQ